MAHFSMKDDRRGSEDQFSSCFPVVANLPRRGTLLRICGLSADGPARASVNRSQIAVTRLGPSSCCRFADVTFCPVPTKRPRTSRVRSKTAQRLFPFPWPTSRIDCCFSKTCCHLRNSGSAGTEKRNKPCGHVQTKNLAILRPHSWVQC